MSTASDRPRLHRAVWTVWFVLVGGWTLLAAEAVRQLVLQNRWLRADWGNDWIVLMATIVPGLLLGAAAFLRHVRAWRSGRWTGIHLGPFRALFALACVTWIGYLWLGQPFRPLRLLLGLGLGYGLLALWLWIRPAFARPLEHRLARAADLALFTACTTVVALELVLRIWVVVAPHPLFAAKSGWAGVEVDRWRAAAGFVHLGFPCNSAGHYDVEPPDPQDADEPLVVCIGDSFSYGVVPHEMHYTTVAERELDAPVEVYNMGVVTVGPPEYLHMLREEALPLEPDLIVVALFLGNDVVFAHAAPSRTPVLSELFDRKEVVLWRGLERWAALLGEPGRGGEGFWATNRSGGGDWGTELVSGPEEIAEAFPWVVDPRQESATFSEEAFDQIQRRRARDLCDPAVDFGHAFSVYDELVRAAGDVPVAFLLIPDEFMIEDAVWEELHRTGLEPHLERQSGRERVVAWMRERGYLYLDVAPALLATPELRDGRKHVYHLRDTHLNARGNSVVGRELGRFLRETLGD